MFRISPDPIGLVNTICTQSPFPTDQKMALLLEDNVKERAKELLAQLTRQEQMLFRPKRFSQVPVKVLTSSSVTLSCNSRWRPYARSSTVITMTIDCFPP